MLIWSNGKVRIPIAWAIWHKEDKTLIGFTKKGQPKYKHTGLCLLKINGQALPYKTKNTIGLELLTKVIEKGLKPQYIAVDSWYGGKKNLKHFQRLHIPCYSRLKSNRKVVFQGKLMSLNSLAKLIPISSFNYKHEAYIKAEQVYLPGFGDIKLLLVRKDKHPEKGSTKYLFSTDLTVSAPKLLLRYRSRWLIETMFRDLKQNLSLESCQARGLKEQEAHIAFVLLAFVILEVEPVLQFSPESPETIGKKKEFLQSLLLVKIQGIRAIIDLRKPYSEPILLEDSFLARVNSFLGRVNSTLDFPFETFNY